MLPGEYRDAVRQLLRIRYFLAYHYDQVENLRHFPQHEHFDNVYGTDQPNSNLFLAFESCYEGSI